MRTVQQILEAAGYACEAYSGRGMGGRECLSITLNNGDRMGRLFADVLEEIQPSSGDDESVSHAFRKMRSESLGNGLVVYFPGVEFTG